MASVAWLGLAILISLSGSVRNVKGLCGYRYSSRIISGANALPNSWPWMVQISFENKHFCGGTLVSPQWVVTAAHCVYFLQDPSNRKKLAITLGEHQLSVNEGTEQRFLVEDIIAHPDWNYMTINNDIALIKLNRPALLDHQVNLACLPNQDYNVTVGTTCFATGWGLTIGGDRDSQADILQQVDLPVVDNKQCQPHYKGLFKITPSMMCTGHGNNSSLSTCNTDSGGPVVCKSKRLGRWYLQGVVSFGQPGVYSVNAKVSKFTKWIQKYI